MTVLVVDRIVRPMRQNALIAAFSSADFPWYFSAQAAGSTDSTVCAFDHPGAADYSQFTHRLFAGEPRSQYFPLIESLILDCCDEFELDPTLLVRAKLNMNVNNARAGFDVGVPHVDTYSTENKGRAVIYYVTASAAGTVIYDQKANGEPVGALTKAQTVEAVQGRAVCFDWDRFHAAKLVTGDCPRIVLNMLFQTNEKNDD